MTDTADLLERQLHDAPLPPLDVDGLLEGVRRRRRNRRSLELVAAVTTAAVAVGGTALVGRGGQQAVPGDSTPPHADIEIAGVDLSYPPEGFFSSKGLADLGARGDDGVTTQVASLSVNFREGSQPLVARVVNGLDGRHEGDLPVSSRGSGVPDRAPDRSVRLSRDTQLDLWGSDAVVASVGDSAFLASERGSAFLTVQGIQFPRLAGFAYRQQSDHGFALVRDDVPVMTDYSGVPGTVVAKQVNRVQDEDPTLPDTTPHPPAYSGCFYEGYISYPTGEHPSRGGANALILVCGSLQQDTWVRDFSTRIRDGVPVY